MELLKTLSTIFKAILPFEDFYYILQQEEYSNKRLLRWLPVYFFKRNIQKRDNLKYTKRVQISLVVTILFWLAVYLLSLLILNSSILTIVLAIVCIILIPVFVLLGNAIVTPYFENIKAKIRKQAITKIKSLRNLKIVLVAGSFGKTTTKNFIFQLTQFNYRTQIIPGNINTPAGIAVWISNNLQPNTELLIAEVDAYEPGEIAKSCEMLNADIAILTNIGDQHLERFKDLNELAIALTESFVYSKPNSSLITTQEVADLLKGFDFGLRTLHQIDLTDILKYENKAIKMSNLSESNIINLKFALKVAELLSIPLRFVEDSISNLELPERRQKLTELYGFEAIDDSYNISFTTAVAGIEVALKHAKALKKKLLVVTAGIPELSKENKDKNFELGKILSQKADFTVILNSMLAKDIVKGFGDSNKFLIEPNLKAFLNNSKSQFDSNEWFLLMQPELNDLYYPDEMVF